MPRLVLVDELPTRTSGKVDRNALPWPVAGDTGSDGPELGGTTGWLAGLWRDVLAAPIEGPEADFFALGGGSLSAAQLVAALRARHPQVTVADLYDHPRLGSLAGYLDELDPPPQVETRAVKPVSRLTELAQVVSSLPLATLTGMQWVVWLALLNNVAAQFDLLRWAVPVNWWWVLAGFLIFVTPVGRMGIAVLGRADAGGRARAGHLSPRRVASTCGSGSPNDSARPAAPRTWQARPGWSTTPARWATGSARASTCTRRRQSPAC